MARIKSGTQKQLRILLGSREGRTQQARDVSVAARLGVSVKVIVEIEQNGLSTRTGQNTTSVPGKMLAYFT